MRMCIIYECAGIVCTYSLSTDKIDIGPNL